MKRRFTILATKRLFDEYLAKGGKITQCPPKERKYVFSPFGLKHADALRKRAERGHKPSEVQAGRIFLGLITKEEAREQSKRDAQEEWDWLRHRALPKQYEPKGDKRCDARSIRSNVPWEFEDQFHDSDGEFWGDDFSECYDPMQYEHDQIGWMEGDGDGFKPSAAINALVRPNYTNSLDRLFGQEVDQKRLTEDGLKDAQWDVKKAWSAYKKTWNEALSEFREEDKKEREKWRKRFR